jgi:hypothetical protein
MLIEGMYCCINKDKCADLNLIKITNKVKIIMLEATYVCLDITYSIFFFLRACSATELLSWEFFFLSLI